MKTVVFATGVSPDAKTQTSFHVLETDTVAGILRHFVHSNGRIDLLVIDIDLDPAVSSIDVALNFRRFFPRLKIILTFQGSAVLCTCHQRAAISALPSGSIAFVRKPFTPQLLRARVEDMLAAVLLKVA
jgi:DNA-binding NtrC family response regulator